MKNKIRFLLPNNNKNERIRLNNIMKNKIRFLLPNNNKNEIIR